MLDDDFVHDDVIAEHRKRLDVDVDFADQAKVGVAPALWVGDHEAAERSAAVEGRNAGAREHDLG